MNTPPQLTEHQACKVRSVLAALAEPDRRFWIEVTAAKYLRAVERNHFDRQLELWAVAGVVPELVEAFELFHADRLDDLLALPDTQRTCRTCSIAESACSGDRYMCYETPPICSACAEAEDVATLLERERAFAESEADIAILLGGDVGGERGAS